MSGVIAAGHPQTAAAGAEIFQQGGNAVDAAVAATFASFITESSLVNIGGGGVAMVFTPTNRHTTVYDFFSNMPGLSGSPPAKLDFRKVLVDFGSAKQPFYIGRSSVAVPGVVAGLCQMAAHMGRLPLPQILAPTIRLARQGVVLSQAQAFTTALLEPILTDTPQLAALYAPNGHIARAGQTLYFPALADTLEQLGRQGAGLFYSGSVGQQMVADQQANGGLLTQTDLDSYRVRQPEPIRVDYREHAVLLPPPSSAGGPLIAFALKLLDTLDLPGLAHNGFEHLRALAEVMRLTNIARARWEKSAPPMATSPAQQVAPLLAGDNINYFARQLHAALAGGQPLPEPELPPGPPNTSHISVADAAGMIAGITTSAGENAGYLVGNTGVMLNNMLGEIDLHPLGFHQLPPGQRLTTMMSPALVLRQQQPVLAVGSGGSNRLRSAILQVVSNVVDFNLPLNQAVDAPRVHFEAGQLQLEGGIAPTVADRLEEAGYHLNRWPERNMFFGGAHAVARLGAGWEAAGDARRGGSAIRIEP